MSSDNNGFLNEYQMALLNPDMDFEELVELHDAMTDDVPDDDTWGDSYTEDK